MNISDNIKAYINKDNIASAIEILKQRVSLLGNWDIQSDMEKVEFSYNSMLDYMLQNYVDDNTKKLRTSTKQELLSINDRLDRAERYKERPADLYCLAMRNYNHNIASIESICDELVKIDLELDTLLDDKGIRDSIKTRRVKELRDKQEEQRIQMFEVAWSSGPWNISAYEMANAIVENENIDVDTRAIYTSAITLSLLEYFDLRKLDFLFDSYLSDDKAISLRALVGVVLVLRHYPDRINLYEKLKNKIKLLADDVQFVKDILLVCLQLQISSATDTITSKMNNDILPSIMAGKAFKEAMNNVTNKNNEDENPEWQDFKANEKAEKKIREMADLQVDGADIYLSNFRLMKSYEFFRSLPHWFYPFDIQSPFVSTDGREPNGLSLTILKSSPFCNSDLYSFAISVNYFDKLGEGFGNSLMKGMSEEELNMLKDEGLQNRTLTSREYCRSYIFDLYRFFNLNPQKSQFFNPFKHSITGVNGEYSFLPMDISLLKELPYIKDDIIDFGNILLRNGLYGYAKKVFLSIDVPEIEEYAGVFQKIGFCLEKTEGDAEIYYEKAYMLASSSVWTLKHLVAALMKKDEYEKCIRYCRELLAIEPENTKCLYNISVCLCRIKSYKEALEYAYKLQYLSPDTDGVHDIMVECLLGTNDMDKLCELVMGSDSLNDTLVSAFVFVQEENYIGAHELFKMAWDMWAKDSSKDKVSFERYYDETYQFCKGFMNLDELIVRMIYDALMLR